MAVTERQVEFLPKERLQALIDELIRRGHTVIGPTVSQGAVVYDEIRSVDSLPRGWIDVQSAGHYRLERESDDRWFGFTVGPHSWKQFLFPPTHTLVSAQQEGQSWTFQANDAPPPKYAFLGVRACELAAIRVQDKTFLDGPYPDPVYRARREQAFIVAMNCTRASGNCFCRSMGTGPRCEQGFDLALTEIDAGFLVEIGTDRGREVVQACQTMAASDDQLAEADRARQQAVEQITKQMDTSGLPGLLMDNLRHPRWKAVGERCLSCTNCTLVCPTCFCASVAEVTDLNANRVERRRHWDSCFNPDFSYANGAAVRNDIPSRYRQWLTHKLDTWHAQFGVSGCVGCGRCIAWCPVGIDLTEEVAAIRETPA